MLIQDLVSFNYCLAVMQLSSFVLNYGIIVQSWVCNSVKEDSIMKFCALNNQIIRLSALGILESAKPNIQCVIFLLSQTPPQVTRPSKFT